MNFAKKVKSETDVLDPDRAFGIRMKI